jgi:hypothetical protein
MPSLRLSGAILLLVCGCQGSFLFSDLALSTPEHAQDHSKVRALAIPRDDGGYSNFASQVIETRNEFDAFRESMAAAPGWNNRDGFFHVLEEASLDFEREALVLIRQGDGSSQSVDVSLKPPRLRGDVLQCTVRVTGAHISRDMVYRCFALAVPNEGQGTAGQDSLARGQHQRAA